MSFNLSRSLQAFQAAITFLTVIPVRGEVTIDPAVVGRSGRYFPAIGLVIGFILVLENKVLTLYLPRMAIDLILITTLVAFTGALHLDGLADTFDGLVASRNREEVLLIMQDSQIGSFGSAALFSVLLLKFGFLYLLPASLKAVSLLVFPVISRWILLVEAKIFPYAKKENSFTAIFIKNLGWKDLIFASLFSLIVVVVSMSFLGLFLMLVTLVFALLFGLYLSYRIKGITGDTLGALLELSEVLILFTLLIGWA
jgi:adenosylcobinamide-GDP ribazoletransferase